MTNKEPILRDLPEFLCIHDGKQIQQLLIAFAVLGETTVVFFFLSHGRYSLRKLIIVCVFSFSPMQREGFCSMTFGKIPMLGQRKMSVTKKCSPRQRGAFSRVLC
jgi:hypothetical protein